MNTNLVGAPNEHVTITPQTKNLIYKAIKEKYNFLSYGDCMLII